MDVQHIAEVIFNILSIIGALAIIATQTPNSNKNKAVQTLLSMINIGAMNMGKSKNAEDQTD